MVGHVVMFKLKPFENKKEKEDIMLQIKADLEGLVSVIPEIRRLEVKMNVNSNEEYDLILLSEFDNLHDVHAYASHPEHIKASQLLIAHREKRACVDYEF